VLGAVEELAVLARAPVQELGLAPELEPGALVQVPVEVASLSQ